ncbi:MAG: hypothetical protein QOI58_2694 [Thermoanaerobaculia bacterium]|jgi:hypothetical protein|nr:hypothetical protein [Thermoanaerobaculia bacterium]
MRTLAIVLLLAATSCRTLDPDALRDELLAMNKADQEVRQRWIKDQKNPALNAEMQQLDARHVKRLRQIVKRYGWPGKSLVGAKATSGAWTLVQHGGSEFLHEMLPVMEAAAKQGELSYGLVATSIDRVRIADGKKQLYGTQFDTSGSKCEPLPIDDPEHLDQRRDAAGLGSIATYTEQLCALYKQPQKPH